MFVYDDLGNPKTYKSTDLEWNYLRNLEQFRDIATYTYNASGIRTSKTVGTKETKFYLNGNKVVAQKDDENSLVFYYGIDGLTGFNHNGTEYIYKKNIQNDIIGIYDNNGQEIVKYTYDAWGISKLLFWMTINLLTYLPKPVTLKVDLITKPLPYSIHSVIAVTTMMLKQDFIISIQDTTTHKSVDLLMRMIFLL